MFWHEGWSIFPYGFLNSNNVRIISDPPSNLNIMTNKSVHLLGLLIMSRHLPLLYFPILLHSWWFNPLMPKVELMGQTLPNLEFLLVVDPKTIFFWFYEKISSPLVKMFIDICWWPLEQLKTKKSCLKIRGSQISCTFYCFSTRGH